MLTRSQRISHENLRLHDKEWLEGYERWFARRAHIESAPDAVVPPPMFTPYKVRGMTLANRIVMSPMAVYSETDGRTIALGHPLGMSGARLALTASIELGHRQAERAVAALCVGVG